MRLDYQQAGLDGVEVPFKTPPGDLVEGEVLRTMNVHRPNAVERFVPRGMASGLVGRRLGVSQQAAPRRR